MRTYLNRQAKPFRLSWLNIFWFVMGLMLVTDDAFSQSYEVTMNQRRIGNKIGVEIWAKDVTADGTAPKLGNATFAVKYNTDFLTPSGATAYGTTDSIGYDMDVAQPYVTIASPFHKVNANGYLALSAAPANDGTTYYYVLDVNKTVDGVGYKPSNVGRGSFVGMLKFDIKNYSTLTDAMLTGIEFNTNASIGTIVIDDADGNDITADVNFVNQGDFTVRGITILAPNGGSNAVNRNPSPALASLSPNNGYPVYFERSGLIKLIGTANYVTNKVGYALEYSLNNGSTWTEAGRVAETNKNSTELGTEVDKYRSGEIDSLNSANRYFITEGDGTTKLGDNSGVMRIIWKGNENFFARSEEGKLRIVQIDTVGMANNISTRSKYTNEAGRKDESNATFVLGRLFFVQLDGTCSYLKTQNNFSTPSQLTVEAWINLNGLTETAGAETGIVVSADGTLSGSEGAWMLYLKDGIYPAFRCRENTNNGANLLANVVSPTALTAVAATTPISNAHGNNWNHIAASVKDNVVTLYVNGEIVDRYTNSDLVSPRLWATTHPIWIGVNPNGGLNEGDYLNAGIKEVKVWRTALDQDVLRKNIAGVYDANGDITALGSSPTTVDERTTLELYYPLQGGRLDIADEYYYQKSANPLNWYNCGTLDNSLVNYRPDRSHIKLTAPVGGEGISNLKDEVFKVRWVSFGLGSTEPNSSDIQIMASRDGGNSWFDAIDNQSPAQMLDYVDVESYEAEWAPYNNTTVSGQDDDLQGILPLADNYSKTVRLRISGTEARNQYDIYDESGDFTVAPYFSIKNDGSAKLAVKENTSDLNFNGGIGMIEAWVRPYRFPTEEEGYFPIITKKMDDGSENMHYSLRLLPTGQLQLAVASTTGDAIRTATSAAYPVLVPPTLQVSDSAWYHVAAYVNLANGGENSVVRFYIDGTPQYVDTITTQLGANVTVDPYNTYPVFFGYEPSSVAGEGVHFVGEMKEVRFWGGNPGNQAPSGVEPSALTKFVQGAATIRANELVSYGGTNYAANLLAAFSFNGGNFVPTGYVGTALGYPTSTEFLVHMSGNGYAYEATRPTIKLVEPVLEQRVPNTMTNLKVRWTGFDYNRNDATETFYNGSDATNHADMQFSVKGGGGTTIQDWQYVASQTWSAAYTNAMTLPASNNGFEFLGANSKSQFAAQLDVSLADPDENDDFTCSDQAPIAAAKTNGRLLMNARSTINGTTLEYDNSADGLMPSLQSMTEYFNITPPSNFTVRVLLEGHHEDQAIKHDIGASYAEGGLKITLFRNNAGLPGVRVDSAESEFNYLAHATTLDPITRGTDGSRYANVPFVFTDLADGRYFVKVDNINHLPIMSAFAAPFAYDGDDAQTWAVESGWDFQNWNGTANNNMSETDAAAVPPSIADKYSAYGYSETNHDLTDYAATGLVYNNGLVGSTGATPIAAMVGGDVVKDGQINAADRTLVILNDGGTSVNTDVTGDGLTNASDRQIVYRNSGKISSLTATPSVSGKVAPEYNSELMVLAPELYKRNIELEQKVINNEDFTTTEAKEATLQAGLNYRVNANPELDGEYLNVPMYITNLGGEFALGNSTFGIQYDNAQLQFVEMSKEADVIFDQREDLGYLETFSAPYANAKDPITDLRTIDIDYNIYDQVRKPGANVPNSATYMGTLRFKVINMNEGIFLNWHPITVVYTTNGQNVTAQGTFEPIPAVVLDKVATVTYPNGGEELEAGSLYTITWSAPSQKAYFHLDYSTDNAHTWNRITTTPVMSSDLSYNWVTPRVKSTEAFVRIVNAESGVEVDRSDATFALSTATAEITRPCSTDPVYVGGKADVIKWNYDYTGNVRFEFTANGYDWTTVTGVVNASDGKADWTLPVVNAKAAYVRMIDVQTDEVVVTSSAFKVLAGVVTLTTPTAKSSVAANSKENVKWTYDNVNKFDLQFSADNGSTWSTFAVGVAAMYKTYSWNVPNVNTKEAVIRAIYDGQEGLEYDRTETFEINGTVSVEDNDALANFSATPNPFYANANVSFTLPEGMDVTIVMYNAVGEVVRTLTTGQFFAAGSHVVELNGNDLPSGTYYLNIMAGNSSITKEIVKVK